MDSGYYAALTGLMARTQALDTAAANLANAQTPGYRAEREYFRSVLLGPDAADSQLGQVLNNYGLLGGDRLSLGQGGLQQTGNPLDLAIEGQGDRLSLGQGGLQQTGNPLDLAIEGQGFFAVQTAHGVRYTRDGSFHRSQAGLLVTPAGEPVLSAAGKPISVPPGDVAVGADGVLSVAGGAVATVGVFTFPANAQLTAEGANRYVAPSGVTPQAAQDMTVHQGEIESANEDAVQGTLDLVVMQRQAEMMQKALTLFHTEFNKFATEDLPRI
jgi:flagellar basal-body rod protein FlgF/flagellar basal-body rod protein FlgG